MTVLFLYARKDMLMYSLFNVLQVLAFMWPTVLGQLQDLVLEHSLTTAMASSIPVATSPVDSRCIAVPTRAHLLEQFDFLTVFHVLVVVITMDTSSDIPQVHMEDASISIFIIILALL